MSFLTLLVCLSCVSFVCSDTSTHRLRHHPDPDTEYDLDRLMNRLDSQSLGNQSPDDLSTARPAAPDLPNSLWDGDGAPLASERWDRILQTARQEELEDEEEEMEERSEEEDSEEQADTYITLNSRSGESYSSWKKDNLGSRPAVNNLFQQHVYRSGLLKPDSTNKEAVAQMEVYKHNRQMLRETQCRVPRPKVVRVADVYPSTNKLYVPSCTVLHQCGEDTGCCGGSAQKCGPKTTKRVELYFYTTYIVSSNSHQRTSSGLEKLPFYNHTECECMDKLEEVMPRDGQATDYRQERNLDAGCKCPSEYTVRRLANGSCSCDCFDKQRDCIKYKKGKEYFNHSDRLCIEMGTCQLPSCDFGVYLRSSGRCPRKHEKFRTWSRFH